MNLFFSKLTGKLLSTEKMERYIAQAEAEIARYRRVEASAELAEYKQLQETVNSAAFRQKKQNLTQTKYKTTSCWQTLQELKNLQKNKMLQAYLQVKESPQLREYLAFRASDDYIKLSDKKLVQQSPDLKNMLHFEKSAAYKAYLAYKDSKVPTRYQELQRLLSQEEFQKENAFWANSKRWLTTEEHVMETRLKQLQADNDIMFFLSKNEKDVESKEIWTRSFADEMQWVRLSDSPWRAGFVYKNKNLKQQHSFANEQQANNGGRNTGSINGTFTLLTKREAVTAAAWDSKKGFVNKEFEYTSDIVQTAETFRQQEGLFMIKLRCTGNIHHAAWLGTDSRLPILTLFHFNGRNIVVGKTTANGFNGTSISGISESQYYIWSLYWTRNEMVWYVNNVEVYRTSADLPKEPLFIALSSFIDAKQRAQEGKLEVDWVRVYKQ